MMAVRVDTHKDRHFLSGTRRSRTAVGELAIAVCTAAYDELERWGATRILETEDDLSPVRRYA